MQDLARINFLLDKARAQAGLTSDAQLGRAIGKTSSEVSDYRKGRKAVAIALQRQLATMAGTDPALHTIAAAVEKTDDSAAMTMLRNMLTALKGPMHTW